MVQSISVCTARGLSIPPEICDSELNDIEFPTALWKSAITELDLHRLNELSSRVKNLPENARSDGYTNAMCEDFIAQVKFSVVQCWASISRSNTDAMKMIGTMGNLKEDVLRKTVVELVFGGEIAAATVFERDDDIRNIAERLCGRKASQVSEGAAEDPVPEGEEDAGHELRTTQPESAATQPESASTQLESASKNTTARRKTQPGQVRNEEGEATVVPNEGAQSAEGVENCSEENRPNATEVATEIDNRTRSQPRNERTKGGGKGCDAESDGADADDVTQNDEGLSPSKKSLTSKEHSDNVSSDGEEPEPRRKNNVRKGGRRNRRNTITRTLEEASGSPRSGRRIRKKMKKK